MEKPSTEVVCQRLRDAVERCPVCSSGVRDTNTPADGIPDEYAFELVFECGMSIGVDATGDDYHVGHGCPYAGDAELSNIHENVMHALLEEMADE